MADDTNIIPLPPTPKRARKAKPLRAAGDQDAGYRFVELHGENILYCPPWHKWLSWTGDSWKIDTSLEINRLGQAASETLWDDARTTPNNASSDALIRLARRTRSANGLSGMIGMAAPHVVVLPDQLDTNHWLLNTPTGTIDLKTGEPYLARRSDLITKITGTEFDAAAKCPRWERFLEEINIKPDFTPAYDVIAYLQRLVGYILTASTREQMFAILHGSGNNGKTTFTQTLIAVLGDYAGALASDELVTSHNKPHPTGKAKLFGLRLAVAAETDAGRKLNEELIKEITGSGTITARRMREDYFDFIPTHKLLLTTNHLPEISGSDEGFWRRIHLIPFRRHFTKDEEVKDLEEELLPEKPGILAWAVRGCLDWQDQGLAPPATVVEATAIYRGESDSLAHFLGDCCDTENRSAFVRAGTIYAAYENWCTGEGIQPMSGTAFGRELTARGFPVGMAGDGLRIRKHIRLKEGLGA